MPRKKVAKKRGRPLGSKTKKKKVEKVVESAESVEMETGPVQEEKKHVETQYDRAMKSGKKLDESGKTRAVVMTPAAAEIADEARKRGTKTKYNTDCIYHPKGE